MARVRLWWAHLPHRVSSFGGVQFWRVNAQVDGLCWGCSHCSCAGIFGMRGSLPWRSYRLMASRLQVAPISLSEANAFVEMHHRHSNPVVGHKFSISAEIDGSIVGVAIVGRPLSRRLDDGMTLEALRVCTTGDKNACSFLYGACWRAAKSLGYRRLITYTLDTEGGASLRASGWRVVGSTPGRSWNVPSRPRKDDHLLQPRIRWEAGDGMETSSATASQ